MKKIDEKAYKEDIDNYWRTLDKDDRNWALSEEKNVRENLGMKLLTDDQFNALQEAEETERKKLQGVHSYDILANPLYYDDFNYVQAAEEKRGEKIIDDDENEENNAAQSDLVRIGLNLAFMTEDKALKFEFNNDWLTDIVQKNKKVIENENEDENE